MRALAKELGVSAAMINKWKKRGMPLNSVSAAKKWREENAKHVPRATGEVSLTLTPIDSASINLLDPDYSDESALKRALTAEKQAGELLEKAVENGSPGLIRQAIQVQTEAQKARTLQKTAYLDLQIKEGKLIDATWIIQRDKNLFDSIVKMLDQLPAELAAKVEAPDPHRTQEQARNLINDLKAKIVSRLEKEKAL